MGLIIDRGQELYREICTADPQFEQEYSGRTIWIDVISGQYEIDSAETLMERLGLRDAGSFYSRRIGELERLPIR